MENAFLEIEDGIVKGIREDADKASIKSMGIPEGVTSIGDFAFYGCESLASVELSASLASIGDCAFGECKSLASLEIPAGVTAIAPFAFDGCEGLESVRYGGTLAQWCAMDGGGRVTEFAKSVVLVGEDGMDLKKIATLKIPEGLTSIGEKAFDGCESLESVEIPTSVTEIKQYAFSGCESLASVTYAGTLAQWCAMHGGGYLVDTAKSVILADENGLDLKKQTALKIPEGVRGIGNYAFADCESLKSVEVPASVTSIGYHAFFIFYGREDIERASYGGTLAQWCEMEGGGNLTSVAKSMILAGENGMDLKRIATLKIPEGVKSIREWAFQGCKKLERVEIPESVTSIGFYAFEGCEKLASVEIPASVTRIGISMFRNCESLASVTYGGTLAQWCAMEGGGYLVDTAKSVILADENGLDLKKQTTLKIPGSVTSISEGAFYGCESLANVEIPEGITSIGKVAFYKCKSLASVSIPASVTDIGEDAFSWRKSLASVTYGGTKEQWKQIQMERGAMGEATVHCADGDIAAE